MGQLGIFGVGESTFAISSKPSEKEFIQFSVMKAGEVTKALHNLSVGDKVGIRAPWATASWRNGKVRRSCTCWAASEAPLSRPPSSTRWSIEPTTPHQHSLRCHASTNFTYWYDVEEWQKRDDIELVLTIDRDCDGWQCDVGLVPLYLNV